jgi:transketolase
VLGDGESNEGQVWEAAAAAAHHRLDNLTVILDHNGFQSTGATAKKLNMFSFADKFRSFGWEVREINGNEMREVVEALDWAVTVREKPQAIIARTTKGKGVPAYEHTNCHFMKITDELLQVCREALKG